MDEPRKAWLKDRIPRAFESIGQCTLEKLIDELICPAKEVCEHRKDKAKRTPA